MSSTLGIMAASPEGYFVTDCPNPAENCTLTCPYLGCDGFMFSSCGTNFAAAPALERHARSSKHAIEWQCHDEECDMAGQVFATSALYVDHIQGSTAHKDAKSNEEMIEMVDVVATPGPGMPEEDALDTTPSLVASDIFTCNEPCCRRFGQDFHCKSELARHTALSFHRQAAAVNKILLTNFPPGPALEAEQQAMRDLRCNAPGCLGFEDVYLSTKGFFGHLSQPEHRQGWSVDLGDALDEEEMEDMESLGMEFFQGRKGGKCVKAGCRSFGRHFASSDSMRQHTKSKAHTSAGEDGGTPSTQNASPFATPGPAYSKSLLSPIEIPDATMVVSPESPSAGRGPPTAWKSPTPRGTIKISRSSLSKPELQKRQDELERRNRELEERVKRLEEQLEKVLRVDSEARAERLRREDLHRILSPSLRYLET
ncbi:hypothetical protein ACJ41O_003143 [Fusarium nematophilum]